MLFHGRFGLLVTHYAFMEERETERLLGRVRGGWEWEQWVEATYGTGPYQMREVHSSSSFLSPNCLDGE